MSQKSKTRKPGQASLIYAVIGSDDGQVKGRARELAAELAPKDAGDFGMDVIDGAAENADQAVTRLRLAIQAIQTLPFFGTQKLVWLKDVNFLSDTVTGRSVSVQAALEEFSVFLDHGLPGGVTFLLSAAEVDKRRSFYKSLGKLGKVEVFQVRMGGGDTSARPSDGLRARAQVFAGRNGPFRQACWSEQPPTQK